MQYTILSDNMTTIRTQTLGTCYLALEHHVTIIYPNVMLLFSSALIETLISRTGSETTKKLLCVRPHWLLPAANVKLSLNNSFSLIDISC